jgi:hypothetical protein
MVRVKRASERLLRELLSDAWERKARRRWRAAASARARKTGRNTTHPRVVGGVCHVAAIRWPSYATRVLTDRGVLFDGHLTDIPIRYILPIYGAA